MGFLQGLFRGRGMAPEHRVALEDYLSTADPLWRQLESEYRQWLDRMGIGRNLDLTSANDPHGEASGVFVWRTIETERTFSQLHPPAKAMHFHDSCVRCLETRHQAAAKMYEALQVADVRSPKSALEEASRALVLAAKLQRQAESQRESLTKLLA